MFVRSLCGRRLSCLVHVVSPRHSPVSYHVSDPVTRHQVGLLLQPAYSGEHWLNSWVVGSVPAGPISEGAAPCLYWLAPCTIYKHSARIKKKKNVIVFSDSRCKNACACRFVPMFSSIAHKIVPRPRFVRVLDCDQNLVVHE